MTEDVWSMNSWDGALVTAFLAVLVFLAGQAVLRFVFEPIQEQRRLIGEVAHALLFYANVYHLHAFKQPDEEQQEDLAEAKKALRALAGRLRASLWVVPFYDPLARLGWVPKKEHVLEAANQLVVWSNSLYSSRGEERTVPRRIIADKLGIRAKIGEIE